MMNNNNTKVSDLRLATLLPNTLLGNVLRPIAPLLDKILGIDKLHQLYVKGDLWGVEKQEFSERLLTLLGVHIFGGDDVVTKIPKEGRCVVVCNHPYGMVEGVIIAKILTAYRADTKIMANVGLKLFTELEDYFIFANPLKPKDPINTSAIKQCFKHVGNDGLLVVFPAGKVSSFQPNRQRITDAEWNRIAIQVAVKKKAPVLPVFISGSNSKLFHQMGQIYYRFRLLMLAREMVKLQDHPINLVANNLIEPKQLNAFNGIENMNDFVRLQCYLNDETYLTPWVEDDAVNEFKELIATADKTIMKQELDSLPEDQVLVKFKAYTVYCGYQHQMPICVQEITRLREITFRELNEGSGEECDTDNFDATYLHLFIFDHKNEEIIGAYRIGQTDLLQKGADVSKLYLSQIFSFKPEFMNQTKPCLEMGRSFIVAEHQNSFHGLLLLWKGIGAYVCKNPRYRTLYGTVSLSKLYDPRSVALINEVMITEREGVEAKSAFEGNLHPEAQDFLSKNTITLEQLSAMVEGIESDGKDVPVLLKQYYKLGAKYHCMGIDINFNHTPGLLLSVDLPKAPEKLLKLYLGKGKDDYLNYKG